MDEKTTAAIIERVRMIMESRKINQSELARLLHTAPPNVSKVLAGKQPLTIGFINRIVADLGVSKEWILKGEGVPYPKPSHAVEAHAGAAPIVMTNHQESPNAVPVYDIDVTAGCAELSRMFTQDNIIGSVSLPSIPRGDVMVRVWGDSMTPVIHNGAFIAIRPITRMDFIYWGQIYVAVFDDYRMVKYLRRSERGDEYIILRSANSAYDDIEVHRSELRGLFLVDLIFNCDIRS